MLPTGLSLSTIHHLLCCYHKQAAYEAEDEVQLATELRGPGAPTWGDTPPAVESTAGTMKAKENSKRKDMNWFPVWSYLQSIQWPLSLVQVSVCKEGRKAGVVGRPSLQALSQACEDPSRASPWPQLWQWGRPQGWGSVLPCAECFLALGRDFLHRRGTQQDRGHKYLGALQAKEKRTKAMPTPPVSFCICLGGSRFSSPSTHVD